MSAICCPRCGYDYPAPMALMPRQHALLSFVADYIDAHGYAPSFEDIARHMGYRSLATVHEHLTNLERKGWIRRRHNEGRSIKVLVRPTAAPLAAPEEPK